MRRVRCRTLATAQETRLGNLSSDDKGCIVPAIYVIRAAQAQLVATVWGSINVATNFLGVYGALRLILAKGTFFVLRIIGVIELGKVAIDVALQTTAVRTQIQNDPELNPFFEPGGLWSKISITTDIATFSLENLISIARSARKTALIMRGQSQTEAANAMDEIALAAENALQLKLGKTLTTAPSWNPTRTITGNLDNPKGVIGVYERRLPNTADPIDDTKRVITELDFPVGNRDNFKANNKEGYKLLNVPNEYYVTPEQFWDEFNKPWMDDLVAKKADIVILSDKNNDFLKYEWDSEANDFKIDTNTGLRILTGFGKEIEYMENLVQQGIYSWDGIQGVYKYVQ